MSYFISSCLSLHYFLQLHFYIFLSFNLHISLFKCLILSPYYVFAFTHGVFLFAVFTWLVVIFSFRLKSPFNISCKVSFVVLNCFSFCLSIKLFLSPSNLNDSLAGFLSCRIFPFITKYIMPLHSVLQGSDEK